jgi:hypothetical protein
MTQEKLEGGKRTSMAAHCNQGLFLTLIGGSDE